MFHKEGRTGGNGPSIHRSELTLSVGSLSGTKRFEEDGHHRLMDTISVPTDRKSDFICHLRLEIRKDGVQARMDLPYYFVWLDNKLPHI